MKYLGETIDMHGGGQDLIFPHHENEIAQSEAATGRPFIRFWLHNGLLNLRGEKMSKSTGHFFAIEDIMKEFPGEVIRFYLLSTHFRSGTEFNRERLREAEAGLERIRNVCLYVDERLEALRETGSAGPTAVAPRENRSADLTPKALREKGAAGPTEEARALRGVVQDVKKDFLDAMDDDFNSAEAIGHVFRLVREVNRVRAEEKGALVRDAGTFEAVRGAIETFDRILGLFKGGLPCAKIEMPPAVRELVAERERARKERNWAKADELRAKVSELGFTIEDRSDGPSVKPAK